MAALVDHDIPRDAAVGYLMATPMGEVRGTARVIRSVPETYGGKTYHRCVLEFDEFDGQGRTTIQTLVNPSEAATLAPILKPDRKPIVVRMAGPTLVAVLIAIPLIVAQMGIFRFYHKDDFFLRRLNEQNTEKVAITGEQQKE